MDSTGEAHAHGPFYVENFAQTSAVSPHVVVRPRTPRTPRGGYAAAGGGALLMTLQQFVRVENGEVVDPHNGLEGFEGLFIV